MDAPLCLSLLALANTSGGRRRRIDAPRATLFNPSRFAVHQVARLFPFSLSLSRARICMIFTFVRTFCRFDFLLQVDKVTFHFFNAKIEILDIVVTFFPVKVQRLLLSSYFAFVARVSKNAALLNRFNDESAIRVS